MDEILDYAIQLEIEGESFYRDLAAKSGISGLKTILNWLADEEVKHRRTFEEMKAGNAVQLTKSTLFGDVKSVFQEMADSKEELASIPQPELYRQAQEIETKSRKLYLDKAEETDNPGYKEVFLKIADEEEKHYLLLEKIINFVSRPQTWLEDAEFNQLEEY